MDCFSFLRNLGKRGRCCGSATDVITHHSVFRERSTRDVCSNTDGDDGDDFDEAFL